MLMKAIISNAIMTMKAKYASIENEEAVGVAENAINAMKSA